MKKQSLYFFFLACLLSLCFTQPIIAQKTKVHFIEDAYEADILQQARAEGKLVLLDFWADYCTPCKTMDTYAFNDQNLADFLNQNFIAYKIDVNRFIYDVDVVKAKYNIGPLPVFILLSSTGKVLHRFEGSMSGTGFLTELRPFNIPANRLKAPPLPKMQPNTDLVAEKKDLNANPFTENKKEAGFDTKRIMATSSAAKVSTRPEVKPPVKPQNTPTKLALTVKKQAKNTPVPQSLAVKKIPTPQPIIAEKADDNCKNEPIKKVAVATPTKGATAVAQIKTATKAAEKVAPKLKQTPPTVQKPQPTLAATPEPEPEVALKPLTLPAKADLTVANKTLADGYYEVDIKKINPKGYSFQIGNFSQLAFAAKEIERIENAIPEQKVFIHIVTPPNKTEPEYKVMVGGFNAKNAESERLRQDLLLLGYEKVMFKKCG